MACLDVYLHIKRNRFVGHNVVVVVIGLRHNAFLSRRFTKIIILWDFSGCFKLKVIIILDAV
jgi:hypothetical protein